MQHSDKPKFAQAITVLGEIYGKEVSQTLIGVYYNALEAWPIDEVSKAIQAHTRDTENGQFFPKPADLIRHLEGSQEGRALEAWSKAVKAIGRVGRYSSIVFDDPVIHKVIDEMGGWSKLCLTEVDEMPFRAAEFAKRYRAAVRFGYESHPKMLIGESDLYNMAHGYQSEPQPALFGSQDKCLLTLQSGTDAQRGGMKSLSGIPVSELMKLAASKQPLAIEGK